MFDLSAEPEKQVMQEEGFDSEQVLHGKLHYLTHLPAVFG